MFLRQGLCLPAACDQAIFNGFSTSASDWLTDKIQGLLERVGIDSAFLPADLETTITLVNSKGIMTPNEFYYTDADEEVPLGVIPPQFNAPLFWTLSATLIAWALLIIGLSITHMSQ